MCRFFVHCSFYLFALSAFFERTKESQGILVAHGCDRAWVLPLVVAPG